MSSKLSTWRWMRLIPVLMCECQENFTWKYAIGISFRDIVVGVTRSIRCASKGDVQMDRELNLFTEKSERRNIGAVLNTFRDDLSTRNVQPLSGRRWHPIGMLLKAEIGKRIEAARKAAKLSQRELSERCGWAGQSRISMYERGEREPTFEDLRKIGKIVDLDLTDLVPHAQQSTAEYRVENERQRRLLRAFDLLKPDEQRDHLSKIESAAIANATLERGGPRLHSLDPSANTPPIQRRRAK